MNTTDFKISYKGRRSFSSFKRNTHYVAGAILIVTGLYGVIMLNNEMSTFYGILLVGGILNAGIGFMGKYLHHEHSFITINPEIIEFKNSSQKPKTVSTNNLLDVVVESNKAEFITVDHQVSLYDFSIFSEDEKKELYTELDKLKDRLITV